MKTVQGILGNAKLSYILQSVKLITVRCHGIYQLTVSYLFVAAFVVLLVPLLTLAEDAEQACPEIGNITTGVFPFLSSFVTPEPQEAAPFALSMIFTTTDRSACQCNVHEVIRGHTRLKARVNRCEQHSQVLH